MKNKTGLIVAIVIIAVIVIIIGSLVGTYNSLVSSQLAVEQSAANIDTQLQRRADLIPNLVSTVKGYTEHETEVFTAVTEAREALLGADTMEEKAEANDEVSSALNRLIAIAEAYPDLKADTQYTNLTDELAGTENRIAVAREDYNSAVTEYNTNIRKFPKNIIANMFGFESAELFEAGDDAQAVPDVNFD